MQILLKIIYFINLILLFSFAANAQNEENDNNDPQTKTSIVNETFPIAVVDMQYIVSKSTAAFKVKEYLENMKAEFGEEIKNEEESLKQMQEELSSQRSILPPDEFSMLENDFRKKVENLQKIVAEKNQLLEKLLSQSVQIIQTEAIKIITTIGREKGLALALDTSSVVIAADTINISENVIDRLNTNLSEVDMNKIMEPLK
tara:strand:- start:10453 stop:11058 length:606 start_codon:yes stop_codon:yes gene_type:complete